MTREPVLTSAAPALPPPLPDQGDERPPVAANDGDLQYGFMPSPIGQLIILASATHVEGIHFGDGAFLLKHRLNAQRLGDRDMNDHPVLGLAKAQLAEYFAGERTAFSVPVALKGTPFQQRVWQALCDIPYGTTTSYAAIARTVGDPNAVRAVGRANGLNPVAILVPCHRVIASSGALSGYAGGVDNKRSLLALEARRGPLC